MSQTFFARTRARRTLKRKCGIFEQAIKYKTKWEKKTLDFLTNQANALNRDINYEFSFPHHAIKKKFLLINTYGACVLVVYSLNSVSWIVKKGL